MLADPTTGAAAIFDRLTKAGAKVKRGGRSLPTAEGLQESRRDRRRAQGAYPRRRGADAIPRLVRARGAQRTIDGNRSRRRRSKAIAWPTGSLRDLSFDSISGAAPHAALPHYRVSRSSNRTHQQERDLPDRFRRAISRRHDRRHAHDDRGHSRRPKCATASRACSRATSRSRPCASPKARPACRSTPLRGAPLWDAGLDYDHGTGHGVGSLSLRA